MSTQKTHHPEYYIPSGDLHLLVGNVQFKVHSYFFSRESSQYRETINTPVAPGASRPGSSDSNPYIINDTSPQDFAKFLWVFYNPKYSVYKATTSEWTSILKISCEQKFPEVKHLAIRGLERGGLTIVQRIHIYVLYDVDLSYLVPLFVVLCKREEAPTDAETAVLGMKTTLTIFRLREALRTHAADGDGSKSPLPSSLDDEDVLRAVCSMLQVDHNIVKKEVAERDDEKTAGGGGGSSPSDVQVTGGTRTKATYQFDAGTSP